MQTLSLVLFYLNGHPVALPMTRVQAMRPLDAVPADVPDVERILGLPVDPSPRRALLQLRGANQGGDHAVHVPWPVSMVDVGEDHVFPPPAVLSIPHLRALALLDGKMALIIDPWHTILTDRPYS